MNHSLDMFDQIGGALFDLYANIPDLGVLEFYYANLLIKTDFTEDEIKEWLEFNPTNEQLHKIYEYVEAVKEIDSMQDEINSSYYYDSVWTEEF